MADDRELFLQHFPFDVFRTHQLETLIKIKSAFDSGKKFVVVEAPTGAGKSPIAITFANIYKQAYILTPQKILQDQYMEDFGNNIVDLKGRNAYQCSQTVASCNEGACRQVGKSHDPRCINMTKYKEAVPSEIDCPYYSRLLKAQLSDKTLFNFKAFLYQTALGRFSKRSILIIDECHNTEQQLVDILAVKITKNQLKRVGVDMPTSTSPEECIEEFDYNNLVGRLKNKHKELKDAAKYTQAEKIALLINDVVFLQSFVKDDKFVVDYNEFYNAVTQETTKSILFRSLYIKNWSNKLFYYGDKVLLLSATILNYKLFVENLGIKLENAEFIRVDSTFPKQNRPIVVKPQGFMTYKCIDKTIPKMINTIEECLDKYPNVKGIIHTHSFKISNYIQKHIRRGLQQRMLYQNNYKSREDMIRAHGKGENTVIVAPAMHEGLNLKEDLSRFQIICKVPYPNSVGDAWMVKRMKTDWNFYIWLTVLKLVQSYGRSVRSADDKAITYIFDSQFNKLIQTSRHMFPKWFLEAVINR